MAKWLLIGDPHAVVDELEDCERLIDGVVETILAEKPRFVCFMGDQHHNHALIHVEVMAFWRRAFLRVAEAMKTGGGWTYALVGNHDMPGDGVSKSNAMMAYQDIKGLSVVAQPVWVDGVLLTPYRHSQEQFLADLKLSPTFPSKGIVLCHQTFDGSRYENGFYAKDGVKLEGLEGWQFISGHIHTPQRFANVMYVGAPRWRTLSDVGINRALVMLDFTNGVWGSGRENGGKLFDTGKWCQKLVHLEDRQEAPLTETLLPNWKYIVDIHGSEEFIKARKGTWAGCRIRTFKTQTKTRAVSESMGIGKALIAFLDSYKPRHGTDAAILREMVAQRLGIS